MDTHNLAARIYDRSCWYTKLHELELDDDGVYVYWTYPQPVGWGTNFWLTSRESSG